nr:class I SAM-dependent methyltransferase [Candidatus Delongbacteria bacterium]
KQYYAERAKEHDKVYLKAERQDDIKKLHKYLKEAFSGLNVLETACGTGYWTKTISQTANSILSTDFNDEVLEIARSRDYNISNVSFIQDEAYKLSSVAGNFNAGFAGFFWSHIPLNRIEEFLKTFHSKLEPGAKVVFIDNLFVDGSSTPVSRTDEDGNTYQIRKLDNGKEFEILKNFPTETYLKNLLIKYSDDINIQKLKYYWIAEYKLRDKI